MRLRNPLTRGIAAVGLALAGLVSAVAAPSAPVQAEVRKIDAAAGKITLKHGAIPELELPAMTLVYIVQNPAQLANIQPGDTIRFSADKVNGQYTAVSISK